MLLNYCRLLLSNKFLAIFFAFSACCRSVACWDKCERLRLSNASRVIISRLLQALRLITIKLLFILVFSGKIIITIKSYFIAVNSYNNNNNFM